MKKGGKTCSESNIKMKKHMLFEDCAQYGGFYCGDKSNINK